MRRTVEIAETSISSLHISIHHPLKKRIFLADDQAGIVAKVGKRLETLGKVLQGKVSAENSEARLEIAQALQALSDAEGAVDKDSSEYWVGVVIRGVAGGAIAHGIDRWKNRG